MQDDDDWIEVGDDGLDKKIAELKKQNKDLINESEIENNIEFLQNGDSEFGFGGDFENVGIEAEIAKNSGLLLVNEFISQTNLPQSPPLSPLRISNGVER